MPRARKGHRGRSGRRDPITLQQAGPVSLECSDRPGDGASIWYVKLHAIKVATLTNAL